MLSVGRLTWDPPTPVSTGLNLANETNSADVYGFFSTTITSPIMVISSIKQLWHFSELSPPHFLTVAVASLKDVLLWLLVLLHQRALLSSGWSFHLCCPVDLTALSLHFLCVVSCAMASFCVQMFIYGQLMDLDVILAGLKYG